MHNQLDKNQLFAEYIAKMTQKLANTFKQLNEMSNQLLKVFSSQQKNQKKNNKTKQKDKVEDLNSNLINGDDQQLNGLATRKKVKKNHRIQQAEQDEQEQILQKKPAQKSNKKNQDKLQKKNQPENAAQQNKKKPKIISHKPKAPTSSFLLFFKQQQHSIAKSYPSYGVVQLTKVAAKCWNDLSTQDKQPYQKMFQQQRKKYQQQMQKYRRQFPEQVRLKQLQKKEKKKKKAKQRRQRQVKQPKQKVIPINSNNDPSLYHQITPGYDKIKIQYKGVDDNIQMQIENVQDIKDQFQNQGLGSLNDEGSQQQQNSLGEDI